MWALLVLTLAFAVGASDTNSNNTANEEKLVIARGKLLVSTDTNTRNVDKVTISS